MDHMDIYPIVVDRVDEKVRKAEAFTAYGLFQEMVQAYGFVPEMYDPFVRSAVHTAMVPHLRDGYGKRPVDFGGRWDAWEYFDPAAVAAVTTPEMIDVKSSAIKAIGYDVDYGDLYVEFHGSGLYKYKNVASPTFVEFLYADSKGTYFNDHIKHRFMSEKV